MEVEVVVGGIKDRNASSSPSAEPLEPRVALSMGKDQERHFVLRPQFPHLSSGAMIAVGCGICISRQT